MVDLFNGSGGTVQLIADVFGYYSATSPTGGGAFTALTPSRLIDTRDGAGTPVAIGASVPVQVTGRGGVPASGVSAVVLNVTVTAPAVSGYITAYPDGTARPATSNLNFVGGQTVPNLVVVPVGANGMVDLFNGSGGTVALIADVSGYFSSVSATGGTFGALTPARLLDTRNGSGTPVAAGATVQIPVAGRGGVPASGVTAVVVNVIVTSPAVAGYVTAYPDGVTRPATSNLNFVGGQTVPNLVVVPVGADGMVDLFNGSGGTVALIADVFGFYTS